MDREVSISVNQLSKKYNNNDFLALNNLSVDVYSGEIFGFLGPNGAGKTTFFSILCGLFSPSKGSVNIFEFDLNSDLESIKKNNRSCSSRYCSLSFSFR